MIPGVYIILNISDGKCYVGSSVDVGKRLRNHRENLVKGTHGNGHLQHSWDKYGPTAFQFKVVALCEEVELLVEEQATIDVLLSMDPKHGYNRRDAGNKGRPSPEALARMRTAHTGHVHRPEHRAKISASLAGKPLSPEHRASISTAKTGVPHSPAHRENNSAAQKGNTNAQGHVCTPEMRARMCASHLGKSIGPASVPRLPAPRRKRDRWLQR
jgi:group I intron endonuclease